MGPRGPGSGRPCGSPAFVERMEALLGRALHPARRGPKPKGGDRAKSPVQGDLFDSNTSNS